MLVVIVVSVGRGMAKKTETSKKYKILLCKDVTEQSFSREKIKIKYYIPHPKSNSVSLLGETAFAPADCFACVCIALVGSLCK